jgi:hypothetical protein
MNSIDVAGRVFIANGTDIENGDLSFKCDFVAKRRKRRASLITYSDGSNPIIICDNHTGLKFKDKMSHICTAPDGTEFTFRGSYTGFEHLFNITEAEIKSATGTKRPTKDGWSFKRK